MDLAPVVTALILGLAVNLSCVGVCLPILVPMILEEDRGWRKGLVTALLFSMGRLVVYMSLGLGLLLLGQALSEEPDERLIRAATGLAGLALMVYGAYVLMGKGSGCGSSSATSNTPVHEPDKDQLETASTDEEVPPGTDLNTGLLVQLRQRLTTGRGLSAMFFGALVGSLLCPPLWLALSTAVLTLDLLIMVLSVLAFWAGSSVAIIGLGLFSGQLAPYCEQKAGGQRGLKDVTGFMLVLMGVLYLSRGLI